MVFQRFLNWKSAIVRNNDGGIDIKTILVALNAKYTHTNLAVRSIREYCKESIGNIDIVKFSINNNLDFVLRRIYESKPDVIGFSCYIWNIDKILFLAASIRKLLPDAMLVAGGPEVSYEIENSPELKIFDVVVVGEGEEAFRRIALYRSKKNELYADDYYSELENIPGIAFWRDDKVITTKACSPLDLNKIPFAYPEEIENLNNRIIYYEASRGCPFGCAYCLSGAVGGVRFLSAERVMDDLSVFLRQKVKQVKFVDRTFNCNKELAKKIWVFLIENDNGTTNFHFEIAADLIDNEMLDILKNVRKGYFQFEIGIQTTNAGALKLINRKNDLAAIRDNILKLSSPGNIRVHLDLIAGLPGEDYNSFEESFNYVYALNPGHLQLGFLKLLKGSALRLDTEKLGIVYRDEPPYEVLFTKELSYDDLSMLKQVSELAETYYNSGFFGNSLRYFIKLYGNAINFFRTLGSFIYESNTEHQAYGKFKLYEILIEFYKQSFDGNIDGLFLDLLKFDMLLNENIKNNPSWFQQTMEQNEKTKARKFYNNPENMRKYFPSLEGYDTNQLSRMCRIDKFSYNIPYFLACGEADVHDTFILFNYYSGGFNFDGINCEHYIIEI